jgi:hypothetical protein
MTRNKVAMKAISPDEYVGADGWSMKREYGTLDDGYKLSGEWVLRDKLNVYVDRDGYRYDLAERNLIVLP